MIMQSVRFLRNPNKPHLHLIFRVESKRVKRNPKASSLIANFSNSSLSGSFQHLVFKVDGENLISSQDLDAKNMGTRQSG